MTVSNANPNLSTVNMNLYNICLTVAWCSSYARSELNQSHPMWAEYFAYSEWFRHRICSRINLPLETEWEDVYRRVGALVEEEYPSVADFQKAYSFGKSQTLNDDILPQMLNAFECIKYQIVGRI